MVENPYAPPVETGPPVLQCYPNPYVRADRGKVVGAGVSAELGKGAYEHLGQRLAQFVADRQRVLDRAHELLVA